MTRIGYLAAVGATALAVSLTTPPSLAQVIVFDPNNYAQNVLRAARALQQINNQITSLQNQAQMLINQAKNLANLPFSSLRQLQSSIQRTQQLLSQAQRIAYDIQQIDRAFSTTYAPASAGASSQALVLNAQTRWQTSVAALQDALRGSSGRRRQSRHQSHANVGACDIEPVRNGSLAGNASRQPTRRTTGPAARRSYRSGRSPGTCSEPGNSPTHVRAGPGQGAASAFPDARGWLPIHHRSDVSLMSSYLTSQQFLRVAAVVFVTFAAAVAVIQSRRGEEAAVLAPFEAGEADALVRELARCRTVTPDDALVLEACRRLWAENRQHFFVSTKSPQLPAPPTPDAPAGFVKSQERVTPSEIDQSGTR